MLNSPVINHVIYLHVNYRANVRSYMLFFSLQRFISLLLRTVFYVSEVNADNNSVGLTFLCPCKNCLIRRTLLQTLNIYVFRRIPNQNPARSLICLLIFKNGFVYLYFPCFGKKSKSSFQCFWRLIWDLFLQPLEYLKN